MAQPGVGDWKHGLCECVCPDCFLALVFCPCFNFCATQSAGEDTICAILTCLFPIGMCCVRANAREKRNIEGGCCGDFMCTICCHCCSAVQIKQEFEEK